MSIWLTVSLHTEMLETPERSMCLLFLFSSWKQKILWRENKMVMCDTDKYS